MADENNINSKVANMDSEKKDDILQNFDNFTEYLEGKVELGKKLGMDEEKLAQSAEKVGDYLSRREEPRNREEKLLQELWKVGNEEQRHQLAHMLVKLVDQK